MSRVQEVKNAVRWQLIKLSRFQIAKQNNSTPPIAYREETRVQLSEAGAWRPYVKTYEFKGDAISRYHSALASAPCGRMGAPSCIDIGIDGYLDRLEAMKLYELAYYCNGDILELGTFRGLSSSIFARALEDRGARGCIDTCDIDLPPPKSRKRTSKSCGAVGASDFTWPMRLYF